MEKFTQLKALIKSAESDAQAFYEKSNKAADTRLRNALQQITVVATEIRKEITERKIPQTNIKQHIVLGRPGSYAGPYYFYHSDL
jgi:hypothetical protein